MHPPGGRPAVGRGSDRTGAAPSRHARLLVDELDNGDMFDGEDASDHASSGRMSSDSALYDALLVSNDPLAAIAAHIPLNMPNPAPSSDRISSQPQLQQQQQLQNQQQPQLYIDPLRDRLTTDPGPVALPLAPSRDQERGVRRRALTSNAARRSRLASTSSCRLLNELGAAQLLKLEMISCDGGSLDFDNNLGGTAESGAAGGRYNAENVLRNDASVYCTSKVDNVNMLLRSAGGRPFTLSRVVVRAPQRSFTSPLKDGLVFVSMDRIDPAATEPYDRRAATLAPTQLAAIQRSLTRAPAAAMQLTESGAAARQNRRRLRAAIEAAEFRAASDTATLGRLSETVSSSQSVSATAPTESVLSTLLEGKGLPATTTDVLRMSEGDPAAEAHEGLLIPSAYFVIDEATSAAVIDFDPPLAGRYVHVKLLEGRSSLPPMLLQARQRQQGDNSSAQRSGQLDRVSARPNFGRATGSDHGNEDSMLSDFSLPPSSRPSSSDESDNEVDRQSIRANIAGRISRSPMPGSERGEDASLRTTHREVSERDDVASVAPRSRTTTAASRSSTRATPRSSSGQDGGGGGGEGSTSSITSNSRPEAPRRPHRSLAQLQSDAMHAQAMADQNPLALSRAVMPNRPAAGHRSDRDNIDIQSVLFYGYGRRAFPRYELR